MFVIGTAGHVDHGKSTLIEALTGIDPDRLAEEKEREMTIDLGFAWLTLESGTEAGVVDVPGHRDFIENMLAGVGGIDLALFVIAADESVMPQTREHLAILDLLEVPQGIIALTKIDLIDDPDWLELVTLEIDEVVADTVLADAPIIPVSARTGEGVPQLLKTLSSALEQAQPRPDNGRPRLAIDRVFTLSGFGTVVTGTLVNGRLRLGDTVEIQPAGLKARIRGLQTHKTKLETAHPGSRVAVNLTGVDKDDIQRGDVLAAPGLLADTILMDAEYRHLPDAIVPLKHNMEVKVFVGAAEVMARTRVLGSKQILPGQTGWLQLALRHPIATTRGDRFILRRPSPGATLGGGHVLDPHPGRRHRRFRPEVVARLETLAQGTADELVLQKLNRLKQASANELQQKSGLDQETFAQVLDDLIAGGQVVRLDQQLLPGAGWEQLQDRAVRLVQEHHQEFSLRLGIPREELRSRLQLSAAVFNPLLAQLENDGRLNTSETIVHAPDHQITFSPAQQQRIDRLMQKLKGTGVNSPSVKACKDIVGEEIYNALVDLGRLRPLSADVVYSAPQYKKLVAEIRQYLQENGRINAAQARDLLHTSRKYAIALLEHMDQIKVTRRVDDDRVLA